MNSTIRVFYETYQKDSFDPFQVFEITPEPCYLLQVSKLRGFHITKGWVADLMDTPDPYLVLHVKHSPNGKKKTKTFNNEVNPVWDETLEFCLDPSETNILEIRLVDANYLIDETLGNVEYNLEKLKLNEEEEVTFTFSGLTKDKNPPNSTSPIPTSEVKATLLLTEDKHPDLRYSLTLCDEEKKFLQERCPKVMKGLREFLGEECGPHTVREVPIIGMLGSGGGFRAMVCSSGVFKALAESKLLDCTTYVAGLSGSSWYISSLYSHPDFPEKSPGELQPELKNNINKSPFELLTPSSLYSYTGSIVSKRLSGQPVSFTDFFGHLLGDTLLRDRKDCKLTDQQHKVEGGQVPLPLYTCLHVKKNVTAKVFQEWVEFSPYEVGIAKYGTFMRTESFGSKLFLGRVVKKYPEFPLHYLQGVWGSAFCILFKQLARESGRKDLAQLMRENESEQSEAELDRQLENFVITDEDKSDTSDDEDSDKSHDKPSSPNNDKATVNSDSDNSNSLKNSGPKKPSLERRKETETSLWQGMVKNFFTGSWLDSCAGRAAMIHNPLRGVSLNYLYPLSPFSPTTPSDDVDFKGTHEALPTDAKKLYLVDSGLTFNSPYPLLLRPQRGVELYLSFDFSARPSDQTPPFKELIVAEKWAKFNNILFPPIEDQARIYAKESVKECYVFRHPTDVYCPVILHFPIINNNFRKYTAPGVLRQTAEEIKFGEFDIFDDPVNPYSLYNFNYSPVEFDRMSQLMEFNLNQSLQLIKDTIAETIERKRNTIPRPPITLSDLTKKMRNGSPGLTRTAFQRLKNYVRTFSKDDLQSKPNQTPQCENNNADKDSDISDVE